MIDLRDYGYPGDEGTFEEGLIPARVTGVHRERYDAVCRDGEVSAVLTGAFLNSADARSDFPTVGDFVLIRRNELGDSGVVRLLPRRSKFARSDMAGHGVYAKAVLEQVVAANFDYVFIMSSLNLDFSVNRILRYLTLARGSGAEPLIVLTKADLCPDTAERLDEVRRMTDSASAVALSSRTGAGLDALENYLRPGKTVVFLGMSGVGKSSLLNALYGEQIMAVREIREGDSRGRHTTTHRQLVMLPSGAMVIDTPGMREIGLWDTGTGVSAGFADVEALFEGCRFSNCGHTEEPGCAVRQAIEDGDLPNERWRAYLSQQREARHIQKKALTEKNKKSRPRPREHGLTGEGYERR